MIPVRRLPPAELSGLTDGTSALLTAMIADTPAPSAAPVVRETFMGSRVIVVMLPEACSHHNCPAHPHAISKALSGIAFSGPCMVVAAVHAPEYLPAYCVAVAKAFPMYSRKTGAGARASRRTAITVSLTGGCPAGDWRVTGGMPAPEPSVAASPGGAPARVRDAIGSMRQ